MRLATITTDGGARVVAVSTTDSETFLDLRAADDSLPRLMRHLLMMEDGLERARDAAEECQTRGLTITGQRYAPVINPSKVICIGLNYRDHAEESGLDIPSEPVVFSKFSSSVTGPGAPITLPVACEHVDYEAELVAVIGKRARRLTRENAMSAIAGYTVGHDVSSRDWQIGRPGSQWLLGKTPDTFAPIGPDLVTADDVPDPHNLDISLTLNGEEMQRGNTSSFIFKLDEILVHLTKVMTLEPGDIIFTGTPPGVGMARKPPVWLKDGDEVSVTINGLGTLTNPVVREAE